MSERYTSPMPVCLECCRGVGDTRLHDAWHASTTPAPEPAAAPAVDNDLLADLGKVVDELHYQGNSSWEADGRGLLASESMQRLRAAWTADVEARLLASNTALTKAVRERDSLKVEVLQIEAKQRDEVRDLDRTTQARTIEDLRQANEHVARLQWEVEEAAGTIQRLRAALPQLPDVGPVTRRCDGEFSEWVFQDGTTYEERELELDTSDGRAVHLARMLAIHQALLDAEAGSASSDDDRLRQGRRVPLHLYRGQIPVGTALTVEEAERLVRTERELRARGGQDGSAR